MHANITQRGKSGQIEIVDGRTTIATTNFGGGLAGETALRKMGYRTSTDFAAVEEKLAASGKAQVPVQAFR